MAKVRTWWHDPDLARSMGLNEYPHTAELCRAIMASGISQTKLAEMARVPQSRISDLLSGKHPISYEPGRRLAEAVKKTGGGK